MEVVSLPDQLVEIFQGSVLRVDVVVIGDVIAVILLRGGIERGDPDGINAEALEVVQPGSNAWQVADAVVV